MKAIQIISIVAIILLCKSNDTYCQLINASGFNIQDAWDNVLSSTDNGKYHQLIGTYRGWDINAVYIAGYNTSNLTNSSTQRVFLGNPNTGRFLGIDFNNGFVGVGTTNPITKLHVKDGALASSDISFDNINVRMIGNAVPVMRFTRWTDLLNCNTTLLLVSILTPL